MPVNKTLIHVYDGLIVLTSFSLLDTSVTFRNLLLKINQIHQNLL